MDGDTGEGGGHLKQLSGIAPLDGCLLVVSVSNNRGVL